MGEQTHSNRTVHFQLHSQSKRFRHKRFRLCKKRIPFWKYKSKFATFEMGVLELNRKYLVLLGVCSTTNANHQAMFKVIYILVLVLQILGLLSGVWFIATYLKSDLNGVLYSGFHTSAYSTSTYSLVVGFVHQDKIVAIFQILQNIYDKCEEIKLIFQVIMALNKSSFSDQIKDASNILSDVNKQCRWITMNFMRFLTLGYFLGSILLAILSALYGYVDVGLIEIEYLYVPFKFMLVPQCFVFLLTKLILQYVLDYLGISTPFVGGFGKPCLV